MYINILYQICIFVNIASDKTCYNLNKLQHYGAEKTLKAV